MRSGARLLTKDSSGLLLSSQSKSKHFSKSASCRFALHYSYFYKVAICTLCQEAAFIWRADTYSLNIQWPERISMNTKHADFIYMLRILAPLGRITLPLKQLLRSDMMWKHDLF